jgi:outer membrane protein assembly factor BamB
MLSMKCLLGRTFAVRAAAIAGVFAWLPLAEVMSEPVAKPASESGPASDDAFDLLSDVSQAWPSFRGFSAAGVADGQNLPAKWDLASGVNIAWKTPIEGLGNSCPVVWGNRIFMTTAAAKKYQAGAAVEAPQRPSTGELMSGRSLDEEGVHQWRVECYSLDAGKLLWKQTAHEGQPHTRRHFKSSHANATPATDGQYLVALFGSEGLYCYTLDGRLIWKQDLGVVDAGAFDNKQLQWGAASSPIIYRDLVIVQADQQEDSFLAGYRLSTGKLIWRTPRDERSSWSTPSVFRGADHDELITVSPGYCRGYDPLTGQERWRLGGFSKITCPTPVQSKDLIFVMSGYRPIMPIYAIRSGAKGDITPKAADDSHAASAESSLAWSLNRGGAYIPTPIVCGEYLYVLRNNGALACYDTHSGAQLYEARLKGAGGYSASPVASDEKLYCTSEAGDVAVVHLGPIFELLESNTLGDVCMATPAISSGKLVVRMEHALVAISQSAKTVARPKVDIH